MQTNEVHPIMVSLGNRLYNHFGLVCVYTKGSASKTSCSGIHSGLISQSCGFDVPNSLPGSEYLGTMVIKCH